MITTPSTTPEDQARARARAHRRYRQLLVRYTVLAFRQAILRVPESCRPWCEGVAIRLLQFVVPRMQRRMIENLRLAFGRQLSYDQRASIAAQVWRHGGTALTEFMRLGELSPAEVRRSTVLRGVGHARRALAKGKGVLIVTGHYGNWEWLAAAISSAGLPLVAIARESRDVVTEQLVADTRAHHGVVTLGKFSWRSGLRALREGKCLGILADQSVSVGGVMGDFLGLPAATSIGVLMLARSSGAAIIPTFIHRDANGRQVLEFHREVELPQTGDEDLDLRLAAQRLNDIYSQEIRRRPGTWLWFHRRWKPPLSVRHGAPKLAVSLRAEPAPTVELVSGD